MSYVFGKNALDFCCDDTYGLGIIFNDSAEDSQEDAFNEAFFEDGKIHSVKKFSYRELRSLIHKITELENSGESQKDSWLELYESMKDTKGLSVSFKLSCDQCVCEIESPTESAKVTYDYYYSDSCSCKNKKCKHFQIANAFLFARIRKLKASYLQTKEPVDKGLFLDYNLQQMLISYKDGDLSNENLEKIKDIVEQIKAPNSDDYVVSVFQNFIEMDDYWGYYDAHLLEPCILLFCGMFEDEFILNAFKNSNVLEPCGCEARQQKSNRLVIKRTYNEYNSIVDKLGKGKKLADSEMLEFILKYRNMLPELLNFYASLKPEINEFDFYYIDKIAELIPNNPELVEATQQMLVKMDKNGYSKDFKNQFYKIAALLPETDAVNLYKRLELINIDFELYKKQSREVQKELLPNLDVRCDIFSYVINTVLKEESDSVKGRFILSLFARTSSYAFNTEFMAEIQNESMKLANNEVLVAYILHYFDSPLISSDNQQHSIAEFTDYFDCNVNVKIGGDNNLIKVYTVSYIKKDTHYTVFEVVERGDNKPEYGINRLEKLNIPLSLIIDACTLGKEEELAKTIEATNEKIEEKLFEKKNAKFVKEYKKLCSGFNEPEIILTSDNKVKIEYSIYREQGYNCVSFKVGNTKMYIVKEAYAFINEFKTGGTIEYGKDLVLTHSLANLDECDAKVIQTLSSAKLSSGRYSDPKNKRYVAFNDSNLYCIFMALKGRVIEYNSSPALLRLEEKDLKIKIKADFSMKLDVPSKEDHIINLAGNGFIVSKTNSGIVIDKVKGNTDEIKLLEFVSDNRNVPIKPILSNFKKNVYSRFADKFDVESSVSQHFRLSIIKINSYFDYENRCITLRTTYTKDDKEIDPASITEKTDQIKIDIYNNYIASLGFEDGVLSNESLVLSFFKMDFSKLRSFSAVYLSESLNNKKIMSVKNETIRVVHKNSVTQVFLEQSDFTPEELELILQGLHKKKKFILLDNNRIVDLDTEEAKEFGKTVEDFGLDTKDLYKKKKVSMVTALKAFAHEKCCKIDKYLRDMIAEIKEFKDSDINPPEISGKLRPYQVEGFRWLSILSKYNMGGILADDMGLGKTVQVISLIMSDKTKKPSLIVCPKSLVFNWANEFAKFDGKTKVQTIYGSETSRAKIISSIEYTEKAVYITSYDSLRNDSESYSGLFNYGILDEAQYIKNVNAQKTKSVKTLNFCHRFALTGTPIENSLVDLWSIFDFVIPGYLEDLSDFTRAETNIISKKVGPFILRRMKEDVLEELPAKYERILSTDMNYEQRRIYEALKTQAGNALKAGQNAFNLLPYLTRLRQICVNPAMVYDNYSEVSCKLSLLKEIIPQYINSGHRILIFSQFVKALESVVKLLQSLKIDYFMLTGDTPAKNRVSMIDDFNNYCGTDVFLISLKAGGTGLNLIGADTVIHLDPWWNIAAENQATDRTHRIGQTKNVEVIKIIASDSIEQRVIELQEEKRDLVRNVISNDDNSVVNATLEDIAFILN